MPVKRETVIVNSIRQSPTVGLSRQEPSRRAEKGDQAAVREGSLEKTPA